MPYPRRGYEAAAITKAITKNTDPGRREDALHLAKTVCSADGGGVRRDWLREHYRAWPEPRFRAALFYAYGRCWITFIGWTYVVDPGPGPGIRPAPAAPARPLDHGQATAGTLHNSGQITSATTGNSASTTNMK